MLYGDELRRAIKRLGLTPNAFAKLSIRDNGKSLSAQAIDDLMRKNGMTAKQDTIDAVERVLSRACPHCGKYMEEDIDAGDPRPNPQEAGDESDSDKKPILVRLDRDDLEKLAYLKSLAGKKASAAKVLRYCIRHAYELEKANEKTKRFGL